MKGLRSQNLAVLFVKGLIVFVVWGLIVFGVWRYLGEEWRITGDVAAFEPELDLYLAEFPFLEPPLKDGVHIRGKAVVVDLTEEVVLPTTFELPAEIAAEEPLEVGTVIQVKRVLEEVDEYDDGSPALRQDALVRIIDLGLECAIGEALVKGGNPPETKDGEGPGFGNAPDHLIPALVAGLPRYTLTGAPVSSASRESTARGGRTTAPAASAFVTSSYGALPDAGGARTSASGGRNAGAEARVSGIMAVLKEGMTVDDVTARFGEPSSRASMGSGDRAVTQCTWRLPDGNAIACRFTANGLEKWEME
jgi:hypothetical protein